MIADPRGYEVDRKRLGSDIVILVVGEHEHRLAVHADLLRANSRFFSAALKAEWLQTTERIVPLPDDDLDTVDLYVQWLYGHKIYSRKSTKAQLAKASDEYDALIEAFIFGDKIQDGDFQDALIDAVIACSLTPDCTGETFHPIGRRIDRVFEGTPPGSPLRRLLLDLHAHRGYGRWVDDTRSGDFLRALVKALYKKSSGEMEPALKSHASSCDYHHHGREDVCYRQRDRGSSDAAEAVQQQLNAGKTEGRAAGSRRISPNVNIYVAKELRRHY